MTGRGIPALMQSGEEANRKGYGYPCKVTFRLKAFKADKGRVSRHFRSGGIHDWRDAKPSVERGMTRVPSVNIGVNG
jgi:hypothetical protein